MNEKSLPLAVLGGSALIALGVYFGLRSQERQVHSGASSGGDAPTSAPSAIQTPVSAAIAPDRTAVEGKVKAAIEARRAILKQKCWDGPAAANPEPRSVKLTWNGTVGTSGVAAFGISEERDAFREGLGNCVTQALADLPVPPAAAPTQVTVEFTLP